MIQVRVGQKYVVNAPHLIQGKVTDPGSGIDQDIAVDQKGRRAAVFGYGA